MTSSAVLQFFKSVDGHYCASTLWQAFSCLSKYFLVYHSICLKDNLLLKQFLKDKSKTHLPKKSQVLSKEHIDEYLETVTCDPIILQKKCAVVLGISGMMRISELVNLCFEDIKMEGEVFIVTIVHSKTDQAQKGFQFHVVPPLFIHIKNYFDLFVDIPKCGRIFRSLNPLTRKFSKSFIGKNTLGKIPREIANSLGLEDSENFTGHCFRRSGATILADSGVNKITLKRAGRWKSDTVCDGYVEESRHSKIQIASAIAGNVLPLNYAAPSSKTININNVTGNIVLNL